jgi:hypothetical protein
MTQRFRRRQILMLSSTVFGSVLLKACTNRSASQPQPTISPEQTIQPVKLPGNSTMKILVMLNTTPAANPESVKPLAVPENKMVWELYKTGMIREMYFRADNKGAVLVVESPDLASAEAAMQKLPMVEAGLLETQLIPLNPFTQLEFAFK